MISWQVNWDPNSCLWFCVKSWGKWKQIF